MVEQSPRPLDNDELLADEREFLINVSSWYKNTDWGFDTKLVWYAYVSIKPYLVGSSCLELGPADGEMTRFLKDDFARVSVVDASPNFVKSAEGLGDNITGYVALFEEFEPPETYDTIIMADVLEHVAQPVELLERVKSWLNPGGRIIVAVPNADSLHRRLGVKLGMLERKNSLNEQDVAVGHRRVYTPDELEADIKAANLQAVAKGGIFLKLLSNAQMLNFEDDKLLDGMFELGKDLPQLCSQIFAVCMPS
jgi:2-polyprenyl-3-methyl-5-hydroxy-6-metoxy-1,4-benzoquinol methylase